MYVRSRHFYFNLCVTDGMNPRSLVCLRHNGPSPVDQKIEVKGEMENMGLASQLPPTTYRPLKSHGLTSAVRARNLGKVSHG